ncbi:MAG TPA: hypothetical protein VEF89_12295 [Solirubrobacteraceae bacterium]|nr:hypothetical protein [Solirubrobacteraceae bacterium]
MTRKILTALTVLSLSGAAGGAFAASATSQNKLIGPGQNKTAPVPVIPGQEVDVAFHGRSGGVALNCFPLSTWNGLPGLSAPTGSPAFPAASCVSMADGTSPSEVVLANGETAVAFQGSNGDLWTWLGLPGNVGAAVDQQVQMMPGTSPSIAVFSDGDTVVAFQDSDGELWTWFGSPGQPGFGASPAFSSGSDPGMAVGTSPSIAALASRRSPEGLLPFKAVVAFQASDGDLWTWIGGPDHVGTGLDTGGAMASGTSPSIAISAGEVPAVAVAFQASDGTLWTWDGDINDVETAVSAGNGAGTGLAMAGGTSPSITALASGEAIAFSVSSTGGLTREANTPTLWTWTGNAGTVGSGAGTGLAMAGGTSPSITALANGDAAVAFQGNTGTLWTWTGAAGTVGFGAAGCANPCKEDALEMAGGTSPSIAAATAPPHSVSLTAKGNVLTQLRKPRTLVLLVYSTREPKDLKLLGRVALGHHPAGLSRITWGLLVHGHRLGAGEYLAELEARIDGLLTIGGPTVKFDIGKSGKLTILAQSCSARAGATAC